MRTSLALLLAGGAGLMAACGGDDGGGDGGLDQYQSIEIDPAEATVTVAPGATADRSYLVYGLRGTERTDITAACTLALDPAFGTVSGATITVGRRGGRTNLDATCGVLRAQSQLTVLLDGTVVVAGTPVDAPDLFGAATPGTDPARLPVIVYPLDRAVSPVNIPPVETQWTAAGNDLFHVTLSSSYLSIDVYTTDLAATLEPAAWSAVAATAAGDQLGFAVEGLAQAAPATRYPGTPVAVVMSRDAIDRTAIYYWASSAGSIMSQTFGSTDAPDLVRDQCTSCHSLSRAGTRLGYSRCVANDCGQLYAGFLRYDPINQTWGEAVNADAKTIHGSYTTFAPVGNPFPSDDQSLAIVSMVNGTLSLYDPDSGAAVASNLDQVSTHGPGAPRSALMADWSPDGTRVVYASTPYANQWIDLDDGRLAVVSYSYSGGQHLFGEPSFLVDQPLTLPGGSYDNFFFPSFSNDGQLIVFNAARAAWRNFTVAASAGQRLVLADAGGAWVKDLTALNGGTVDADITWPHWAPGDTGDYYWIVFSSERDYGHRVTAATSPTDCKRNGVQQCKQIWIGGISKAALASGQADPSAPPMWLPGQDPQTTNISPFWTSGIPINRAAAPPPRAAGSPARPR